MFTENTVEDQCELIGDHCKLNTDEQNTCEFHPDDNSFNERPFDPKDIQYVKSFVKMNNKITILRSVGIKAFKLSVASLFVFFVLCFQLSSCSIFGHLDTNPPKKWVGTWSTAPQLVEPNNMPPAPGLTNNSLRQIVRVSIGGDTLRVRFSNEFSTSPVTMKSVQISASSGGGSVDSTTNCELKFNGSCV